MKNIFKRIISIISVILIVLSSLSIPTFAVEETSSTSKFSLEFNDSTEYVSYLDQIKFMHKKGFISDWSVEIGRTEFDSCPIINFMEFAYLEVYSLNFSGYFVIAGGVDKYAVEIEGSNISKEYDVYNYADYQDSSAVPSEYIEQFNNCNDNLLYDIDVYLGDFVGDFVTITLLAYSNDGGCYEALKIYNFPVGIHSKRLLFNEDVIYCRYCSRSTFLCETELSSISPYNDKSCLLEYKCSSCSQSTFLSFPHVIDDSGLCSCGYQYSGCEHEFNLVESLTFSSEDYCKENIYECFYCQERKYETIPHNYVNNVCSECNHKTFIIESGNSHYKYSTFINKIYYDYGTFDSDLIITSPFSVSSKDAPYQVDCFSELFKEGVTFNKLRVYGWFLTNGGVRKYAVKITQGDKTLEYDVHNYSSEAKQDGVTNKAIKDGLCDFDHNAIYDIDVYLDDFDFEGDLITITLLAYSRYGEIFEVWKFSNASVWDEVSLSATSTSYCRYCWAPVNNWVYSDPYSHRNCGIEYVCTCGKGSTFVMPLHSMTEIHPEGYIYCDTCSIADFETECVLKNVLSYLPLDDIYHYKYYECEIPHEGYAYDYDCGDVVIKELHTLDADGNCVCGMHIHNWKTESINQYHEETRCSEITQRCVSCDIWSIVNTEHNSNGCVCIDCGYLFSSHDLRELAIEYVYEVDACYIHQFECSKCKMVISGGVVPHTFIDGVCTECNYAFVPEPDPDPDPGDDDSEVGSETETPGKLTEFINSIKSKAAPLIALFILVDVLIAGYFIWIGIKKAFFKKR